MKLKLIILLMGTIFLGGCANGKVENDTVESAIYQTNYKEIEAQVVTLKELSAELGQEGVQLAEYDLGDEGFAREYYFEADQMNVNVSTKGELENGDDQILQRIQIRHDQDTQLETLIHENSFFKSIAKLTKHDEIIPWVEKLEAQYHELNKNENPSDEDNIADIMVIGKAKVSFVGHVRRDNKLLEITWGSGKVIPKELEGIARELEHQGLLITSYENGFKGNMLKVESAPYHLFQSNGLYSLGKNQVDINNLVAYKVMYDPSSQDHYSAQLYGLIPDNWEGDVMVEDMVGIDAISRVMDMSWDDFSDVTDRINQDIAKLKESLHKEGQWYYNVEGKVSGYRYEIFGEDYIGLYRFTVLLEKEGGTVHK